MFQLCSHILTPKTTANSGPHKVGINLPITGVKGYVHSEEVGGFVDGPGIRYVLFFSGCPLRCQYCHNPDSWEMKNGNEVYSGDVIRKIAGAANFLKRSGGGVTFSGGEPLAQANFLLKLLEACKDMGLHTAFDTSGFPGNKASDGILNNTDLVLLDIKSFDGPTYRKVTGVDILPTLDFARRLSDMRKPAWIRFVLVPGLTDKRENIEGLADFVVGLANVELVEVLPFHQMGKYKWKEAGIPYALENVLPPTKASVEKARQIFRDKGLTVR